MTTPQYKALTITPIHSTPHAIRVTISNSPINLLDPHLLQELYSLLTSLTSLDSPPKIVVFSSADSRIWLSHLDLHLISAQHPPPPEVDAQAAVKLLGESLALLNELPVIFIAEINGLAVGGGNEFAVNMDMRFAGPGARLGIPEVAGGVVHGGGLHRMTQLIGPARAMEWNLPARGITGKEAARIGWVNETFESEGELREYVDNLAERIAGFPRGGIEATKRGIQETITGTGNMRNDMKRLVELAHTEKAQRAISAFIGRGGD